MRRNNHVTERLEGAYAGLSPRLQQAARYMLDAPDEVAFHSLRQLAGRAGVHPSTLVRLARQLGYPGYADFRAGFQARLSQGADSLTLRAHQLRDRGGEPGEALLQDLQAAAESNLRQTFAAVRAAELETLADHIVEARRVYVVGLRKCYPVAHFIHYCFRMVREDVRLVSGHAGTLADELRDIGGDDVLVAISYAPYTRDTVRAAELAVARDARLVALTDSVVSPIAAAAAHAYVVANAGPTFFRSIAAAMALGEAIVAFVLARGGDASLRNLRGMERQLDRFATYWEEGNVRKVRA